MFPSPSTPTPLKTEVAAGEVLRERHQRPASVLYLDSGRVLLGVREDGQLRHQLGAVQGPCWLDAAPALLGQACMVDMVADTRVQLRRMPLEAFRNGFEALPSPARALVVDMARGYCQQTELAVSRLAQDAEARCAQWLLRHAQHDDSGALRVTLHQRKRLIAAQLGIAPETLSRVLWHLRDHGLIAGTGSVLSLLQPGALQMVAGGG
ncbi:Crp/Fnr family transcriptional regulator [Acidovorax sp. SUPP3334]|uniref:Crp/Fnr family transcriptional regulator n=1 Tax=Acidovorax sp. SUPP3334 TaxID=2920881 RepID=UPI0023DE3052|nr:Crp/Fnr family transcriptional regulator [Acidovorax sp. SUPP3334]GKT22191.1 Crp/Fnr family transcriptional regulator [Acidovorax sp. SUPP3334]